MDRNDSRHLLLAALAGALGLQGVRLLSTTPEPWTHPVYLLVVLPAITILCGILGYRSPLRPWLWGGTAVAIQALLLLVSGIPGEGLAAGFLSLAILSVPVIAAGFVGAVIRRSQSSWEEILGRATDPAIGRTDEPAQTVDDQGSETEDEQGSETDDAACLPEEASV